ncbi:hypothetical protein BH20CHL6_BH20CHL6_00720 [soil metagenome]
MVASYPVGGAQRGRAARAQARFSTPHTESGHMSTQPRLLRQLVDKCLDRCVGGSKTAACTPRLPSTGSNGTEYGNAAREAAGEIRSAI